MLEVLGAVGGLTPAGLPEAPLKQRWVAEGILDDLPVERKRPFGSFRIYGFGVFDFEIPQKASQPDPGESQCGGGP